MSEKVDSLDAVWHILGQDRLSGKCQNRLEAYDFLLACGLPPAAIRKLSTYAKIDLKREGPKVFGLGSKTIQRRLKGCRLPREESTRLFCIADVLLQAEDAFDSHEKAMRWLHKPCRALRNETPLFLLGDDVGRGLVEDVLGQIKYGLHP